MDDKKIWSRLGRHLTEHPFLPYLYLFAFIGLVIVGYSYFKGLLLEAEFQKGILIESFGMLFDLLVIGAIIGFIKSRGERRREIKRYMEEIDDFRWWESDEAKFRIVGNIKRLNRKGVTDLNLHHCYLEKADLRDINLKGSDLSFGNLRGANLENANLQGTFFTYSNLDGACLFASNFKNAILFHANLRGAMLTNSTLQGTNLCEANLRQTMGLTIQQLADVNTLFEAQLEPSLGKQIKEHYPHLLENPNKRYDSS